LNSSHENQQKSITDCKRQLAYVLAKLQNNILRFNKKTFGARIFFTKSIKTVYILPAVLRRHHNTVTTTRKSTNTSLRHRK